MKNIFIIYLLFTSTIAGMSDTLSVKKNGFQILADGLEYLETREYTKAIEKFNDAKEYALKNDLLILEVEAVSNMFYVLMKENKNKKAEEILGEINDGINKTSELGLMKRNVAYSLQKCGIYYAKYLFDGSDIQLTLGSYNDFLERFGNELSNDLRAYVNEEIAELSYFNNDDLLAEHYNSKAIELAELSAEYYVLGEALLNRAIYYDCHPITKKCYENISRAKNAFEKLGITQFMLQALQEEYAFYRNKKQFKQALKTIDIYRDLSIRENLKYKIANSYKFKADVNYDNENYSEAINNLKIELDIRKQLNDSLMIARCLSDLTYLYSYEYNADSIIYYGKESFRLYKKLEMVNNIIRFIEYYLNALYLREEIDTYAEIIEYLKGELLNIKEKENLYYVLKKLGYFYAFIKKIPDYDEAEKYLRIAYNHAKENKIWKDEIDLLMYFSIFNFSKNKYEQSKIYLDLALKECKKNDCDKKVELYTYLAQALAALNDTTAIYFAEQALENSSNEGTVDQLIVNAYGVLIDFRLELPLETKKKNLKIGEDIVKRIKDKKVLFNHYQKLAWGFSMVNDIEKEEYYLKRKLVLDEEINNRKNSINIISQIIVCMRKKKESNENEVKFYLDELLNNINNIKTNQEFIDVIQTLTPLELLDKLDDKYFVKALQDNKANDPIIFEYYGDYMFRKKEIDSAIFYYQKALENYKKEYFKELAAFIAIKIAKIYNDYKFDFKKQIIYDDIAIDYLSEKKINYEKKIAELQLNKALAYMNLGEYDKFLIYAELGIQKYPEFSGIINFFKLISFTLTDRDSVYYYLNETIKSNAPKFFRIYAAFMKMEYSWAEKDRVEFNKLKDTIITLEIEEEFLGKNSYWKYIIKGIQTYFKDDDIDNDYFKTADSLITYKGNLKDRSILNKTISMINLYDGNIEGAYFKIKDAIRDLDNYILLLTDNKSITQVNQLAGTADLPFMLALAKHLYENTKEEKYLIEMINAAENFTVRTILNEIKKKKSDKGKFVQDETNALKTKINDLNQLIINSDNEKAIEKLLSERDELIGKIKYIEERTYNIGGILEKSNITEIREKVLKPNELVIRYFINQYVAFCIAFDLKNIWYYEIPEQKKVELDVKIVKNFYQNFSGNMALNNSILTKNSYSLYKGLIEPIADIIKGKHIIIIPDKILNYLPFELLITDTVSMSSTTYSKFNKYLLNDCTISYIPSLSLLKHVNNIKINVTQDEAILFGKSVFSNAVNDETNKGTRYFSDFKNLNDLPGVENELNAIQKIFNKESKNVKAKIYIDENAREEVIKKIDFTNCKYLHLATHGMVDDDYPDFTAILLDEVSIPKRIEDGLFNTYEIMDLKNNLDMVVLSACNTALGKLYTGEGIIGLNRAFFISGTKTICATLWSIADKSTALFMNHFYKNLLKGYSKVEALKNAKLEMIANEEYASPYYWAPYILAGAIN